MEGIISLWRAYTAATSDGQKAKCLRSAIVRIAKDIVNSLSEVDAEIQDLTLATLCGTRPGLIENEPVEDSRTCSRLRLDIYKHIIALMSDPDSPLTDTEAEKLISVLTNELDYLGGGGSTATSARDIRHDLSHIIDGSTSSFESDTSLSWAVLPLIAKALNMLQAVGGSINVCGETGASNTCQTSNYAQNVVRRICHHSWPAKNLSRILVALKEFQTSDALLVDAVTRGASRARVADIQDLPVIVHQLLNLGGVRCKDTVLAEIVKLFNQLEKDASRDTTGQRTRQLLQVESSVLLHIDMAVKHNADLGQAWLKQLKSPMAATQITPFSLALSFVIAGIQRFTDQVLDALKKLVVNWYRDNSMLNALKWLPRPHHRHSTTNNNGYEDPIGNALLTCVKNSIYWQGAVVQPAVTLAVALMDGATTKAVAENKLLARAATSPAATAADLGSRLLLEVFSAHPSSRRELISLCTTHIAGRTEEAAAPFLKFLALLVRRDDLALESHANDLRVPLDHLSLLPSGSALSLLLAVWPLCLRRRDVRDHVVLLLRKAMFGRELGARLLAARGFLFLLAEELSRSGAGEGSDIMMRGGNDGDVGGPSCSQAAGPMMSQMDALKGGPGGGTLLQELMGFMRRCLAHQPAVRMVVYQGLPILLQLDPAAQESVAELLLPHLSQYYEHIAAINAPLKLESCARLGTDRDAVRLLEPIQYLLACAQAVAYIQPQEGGNKSANAAERRGPVPLASCGGTATMPPSQRGEGTGGTHAGPATTALRTMVASITSRMASCPLEEYNFDSSTEFGTKEGGKAQLNSLNADILLGCFESLMESCVNTISAAMSKNDITAADKAGQELSDLFAQHKRLTDLVIEGTKAKGGRSKANDGLTQALGAGSRKRSATAAGVGGSNANNANSNNGQTQVTSIEKRVPVLSVPCLVRLLEAVVNDGLTQRRGSSVHTQLARDTDFRTFVLTSCLRKLESGNKEPLEASIAAGTAGNQEAAAFARQLFGLPDWTQLAGPLFSTAHTTLCAYMHSRSAPVAGTKKEKDPTAPLTLAASKVLEVMVVNGWSNHGVSGVASIVGCFPAASSSELAAAALPEVASASEEQGIIADRTAKFKRLLDDAVAHCCGKELEPLCRCIAILAECLPGAQAEALGEWAKSATLSAPTALAQQSTAAAAVTALSLRCNEMGGLGKDTTLLCWLAKEIADAVNEDDGEGAATLKFTGRSGLPVLASHSIVALVRSVIEHIEVSLGGIEWALGKLERHTVRADQTTNDNTTTTTNTATGGVTLISSRSDWEQATFERLHRIVEACTLLMKGRLQAKSGNAGGPLVHANVRLYRVLAGAVKAQIAPKGCSQAIPGRTFRDMVEYVNTVCAPETDRLLTSLAQEGAAAGGGQENNGENDDDDEENENKKPKTKSRTASTTAKTDKAVPELVFQKESYEKNLIMLGNKTKINYMLNAKRSAVRGFKFNIEKKSDE